MAEIAGVQGGATFALETMLRSLQHRVAHITWASRTKYAASLTSTTLPLSRYQKFGPQFKQNLKRPSLPQLVAVWDPFTVGFWDISFLAQLFKE
jgi:hypothetical protein